MSLHHLASSPIKWQACSCERDWYSVWLSDNSCHSSDAFYVSEHCGFSSHSVFLPVPLSEDGDTCGASPAVPPKNARLSRGGSWHPRHMVRWWRVCPQQPDSPARWGRSATLSPKNGPPFRLPHISLSASTSCAVSLSHYCSSLTLLPFSVCECHSINNPQLQYG